MIIEKILSLHDWQNISPVIQEKITQGNENAMEFRNSFPSGRSYELRNLFPYVRKLFSYVPEIHVILMIFLRDSLQLELNRFVLSSTFTFKVYAEEN